MFFNMRYTIYYPIMPDYVWQYSFDDRCKNITIKIYIKIFFIHYCFYKQLYCVSLCTKKQFYNAMKPSHKTLFYVKVSFHYKIV